MSKIVVCKTQTSYFNAESDVWVPRNVKCTGINLRVPRPVSNAAVDKFVKELDIGTVNQIPSAHWTCVHDYGFASVGTTSGQEACLVRIPVFG